MKSMKMKVISSLVATSLILTLSVSTVKAEENNSGALSSLLNQQKRIEDRQERQDARKTMEPTKATIKQNHTANIALREEIKQKKAAIKTITKDIKTNHKQLTSDALSKIEAQAKAVKDDVSSLKSLNGTISPISQKIKDNIKNKNYKAAETELDSIISIQNTRTSDLKKLSSDMDSLLSILQSAEAAAAPTTTPSNNTSTT